MEKKGFKVDYKPGMVLSETKKIAKDYDAVIVRSYKLHDVPMKGNIKAVGRAGAGVNNIPVEKCSENGVVVFNAPGANANAVKELVICCLILASRGLSQGIEWTKTISVDVSKTVEKEKSQFKGKEILGKKLAVIGLGAIGCEVANAAVSMGMDVTGYDPYITVENALRLLPEVKKTDELSSLLSDADYLTIHVPISDKTMDLINDNVFSMMKPGIKLLNFSRKEIVVHKALFKAINKGIVKRYITDFPDKELVKHEHVINVPHLGASTHEAEENCAGMIAEQVNDFLKKGNIKNSVNYPTTHLDKNGSTRLVIFNKNVPGVINSISKVLSFLEMNISSMINKSKGDYAYNIFDIDSDVKENVLKRIREIDGVIRIRKIQG